MFYKIASVPVVGVYQSSGKFSKCAQKNADISNIEHDTVQRALNLISPSVLAGVAKVYDLSPSIDDYIFPVPRAVAADIPNSNGDMFPHEELVRFSSAHKCLVFQTFRNVPLHIEHASANPKAARGFIPDAYYMQSDPKDRHVLTVVAMDTTKDPPLAEGLLSGDIDKFSMGCACGHVDCSYCNKRAYTDNDLCDHIRWHKMSYINGKLVYEKCGDVEYRELSSVGDPAYAGATTQYLLKAAARKRQKAASVATHPLLYNLVSTEDAGEFVRYVQGNLSRLPESVLRVVDRLI